MTKRFLTILRARAMDAWRLSLLFVMTAGAAHAAPLEPEACALLNSERTGLVAQGLEADMAKGAAWARQSLPQDRLFQIKRLIEVNEQLSFRCGLMVTARPTLLDRTPPPVQAATTPAGEDPPPQKKPTKSKPKPAAAPSAAGVPGSKTKPSSKDQAAKAPTPAAANPVTEAKSTQSVLPAQKSQPVEKAGN